MKWLRNLMDQIRGVATAARILAIVGSEGNFGKAHSDSWSQRH
jgi:hypothetical protein